MGFFDKLKAGLRKTGDNIGSGFNSIFSAFGKVDGELLDELLEILISSDAGYETSEKIIDILRDRARHEHISDADTLKKVLAEIIADIMRGDNNMRLDTKPSVIVAVGVNGSGKTTTAGKLAYKFAAEGKHVIIAAADTFRAAAVEQLEIWADRAGSDIIKHQEMSDPAAVVFDGIHAAKARNADILICDTAGRLNNKKNLMDELAKIIRVIDRELPDADKEILLVLDASTGQNAVSQAKDFAAAVGVTGVVLTKLDGTAKGGMTLSVKNDTGIPVKFIGVGEQADDLQYFDPDMFASALIGMGEYK